VAVWVGLVVLSIGFTLPSVMDAEHSGSGSGVIQALRQVGGTIGVAILGTVPPDDFAVRNWAGAVVGVLMAAYPVTGHHRMQDYMELIYREFAHLEAGLPF